MLNSFVDSFKVFINKKTPIIIAIFLFTFFCFNYISNTLLEELVIGVNFKEYPMFLINYYQYDLLWFILSLLGLFFIINIATYLISHIVNKSKKNIFPDIYNCLIYTVLVCLFFSFLGLIGFLSIIYYNLFSIIVIILLMILTIIFTLITTFGIIFLPVSKNIKESFSKSWILIKQKFWLILVLLILLGVVNFGISYLFEYLNTTLFSKYEYGEIILLSVVNAFLSIYTIAVFSSFIRKKK